MFLNTKYIYKNDWRLILERMWLKVVFFTRILGWVSYLSLEFLVPLERRFRKHLHSNFCITYIPVVNYSKSSVPNNNTEVVGHVLYL